MPRYQVRFVVTQDVEAESIVQARRFSNWIPSLVEVLDVTEYAETK